MFREKLSANHKTNLGEMEWSLRRMVDGGAEEEEEEEEER